MTYLSPLRVAVVRMPGDVGAGVGLGQAEGGEQRRLGEAAEVLLLELLKPPSMTGAVARPLQPSEVWMPEQPQDSSSSIRQPSR